MAQSDKPEKGKQWQKQADHFAEVKEDCQEVLKDPAATPEELADAQETIAAMDKNLARLQKHGVEPKG